ncbi:MAG: hypothetical protein EXR95_08425 [Gemmatimonadetes bacterium]|nr:hypothetical protein [Gemmatimonadota bacterium]
MGEPMKSLRRGGTRLRMGQAAFASVYADALLAVVSVICVPYLIRHLGTEPYGILGIVSVLAGQLAVLHSGVAESLGRGGEALLARLAGVAVVAAVASLMVGWVFLVVAPAIWRGGFNVSAATLPLALASVPAAAALVALTPATAAVYGILTARERFLFLSTLRLYQGTARVLGAVLVVHLGGSLTTIFWVQAMVDLSAVLVGGWGSWSGAAGSAAPADAGRFSLRDGVVTVLLVGMPFALVSLFSGLLTDAEKLAIGLARSVEDFTYYTVPFNAVIKFTVISGAIVRVLMPRVGVLGAQGAYEEARLLTERSNRILITAMVGLIAPFVALTPELLRVWVGESFVLNSTAAARILLVGVAVNTAAFPAHAAVLARGRPAHLTALYACEVALHLAVVYLLVTHLWLVGAAAAWTVRVLIDTLAQRVLAERALGAPLRDGRAVWGPLALLGAFAAVAPLLSLWPRVGLGAVLVTGCLARLARGRDAALLLDSLLPWRWGEGRAS